MKTLTRSLLVIALLAPFASAQTAPKTPAADAPKDTAKKEKLSERELQIVAHYHADNLKEINLGKVAMKQGASQAVKSHGEMLVKDHGDFDQKLVGLAKKTGQAIPAPKPETDAKKAEMAASKKRADALLKLKGAAFDAEYSKMMAEEHHKAVAEIDAHIAEAKHAELVTMLREVKPVLQRHADHAHQAQAPTPTPTPTK
jgi:putative membrane protein